MTIEANKLPQRLLRAAKKGRLVVFLGADAPKTAALPAGVWVDEGQLANAAAITAGQIEQGELRAVPAGSVVSVTGGEALGTRRRPTRLRVWLEEVLRRRTALVAGENSAVRCLITPAFERRHFVVTVDQLENLVEQLSEQTRGVTPKAPPPLPAVSSRWGLAVSGVAAAVAVLSWLSLYVSHGGAQNFRWVNLIPGAMALLFFSAALFPLLADAVRGQELPATESYARMLARWSRWPRAPIAVALLVGAALAAQWVAWRYVPATFLVLYEAAAVDDQDGMVGACKAEEPCILVVGRDSHLHFEGAEGACGLDLPLEDGMIVVDLQQDSCGLEEEPEGGPDTRGDERGGKRRLPAAGGDPSQIWRRSHRTAFF